jgi:PKHD-type hydroxylase
MAYQSVWYFTELPKKVIDILEEDLIKYNSEMKTSLTSHTTEERTLKNGIRKSKNAWINSNHWISGFLMHYVLKANRENFLYDIDDLDGAKFQYTQYDVGDYYHWHTDSSYSELKIPSRYTDFSEINEQKDFLVENTETMRKLSFVLQPKSLFVH